MIDHRKNFSYTQTRERLAWFIVERMNDSVGFDEAYEEVGEYLNIIIDQIDKMVNNTTRYEKGEWINFYKGFDTAIEKVKAILN